MLALITSLVLAEHKTFELECHLFIVLNQLQSKKEGPTAIEKRRHKHTTWDGKGKVGTIGMGCGSERTVYEGH